MQGLEVWFVTSGQHLCGEELLKQVAADSGAIAPGLAAQAGMPVRVVFKQVLTGPEAIHEMCQEANQTANCVGIVAWMHTFLPAKMWIAGFTALNKPLIHLHTQFNRDIPWSTIDMDPMNQIQSAHGGRELGFSCGRLRLARTVVVVRRVDDSAIEVYFDDMTRPLMTAHDTTFTRCKWAWRHLTTTAILTTWCYAGSG